MTLGPQLLSWALTFAVTLSLPGYVGDAGLGKMAFAVSLAALFGTVIPLGTSTVLVREIARDRSRTGELLLAAICLRVPLGLLMTGLLIGTISVLHSVSPAHYPDLTRTLVIIAALGMVVGGLNDALASALQGQENLTRQNIAVLTEKFLSSGLVILADLPASAALDAGLGRTVHGPGVAEHQRSPRSVRCCRLCAGRAGNAGALAAGRSAVFCAGRLSDALQSD